MNKLEKYNYLNNAHDIVIELKKNNKIYLDNEFIECNGLKEIYMRHNMNGLNYICDKDFKNEIQSIKIKIIIINKFKYGIAQCRECGELYFIYFIC